MNNEQTLPEHEIAPESSPMRYPPVKGLLASAMEAETTDSLPSPPLTPAIDSSQNINLDEDVAPSTFSEQGILDDSGMFRPNWWKSLPELSETGKTLNKFKSPEALAKSYTELEKLRAYPDPHDEEKMKRFRSFLGLPEKEEEYKLSRPESSEQWEHCWDNDLADKVAATAYRYAIPHTALQALADVFTQEQIKHIENYQSEENRILAIQKEEFLSELRDSWGAQCQTRLKAASNTLQQLCAEANIDSSELSIDSIVGSNPSFIKLLDHIGTITNDSPLKGAERTSASSALNEAQRMENDPSHPLHEAYMNYNHPNHEYANKLYDEAILTR